MTEYVTIVTSPTAVTTTFNVYSGYTGFVISKWRIEELVSVYLMTDGSVGVRAKSGMSDYVFSHDGSKGMKVDSVNGVVPTSASHLYDLISGVVP